MKPTLPEPHSTIDIHGRDVLLYTRDQMLSMYRAGLLRAAEICRVINSEHGEHPEMALTCADAIRKEAGE